MALVEVTAKGATKLVAVRVPVEILDEFNARARLRRRTLTDLVVASMRASVARWHREAARGAG